MTKLSLKFFWDWKIKLRQTKFMWQKNKNWKKKPGSATIPGLSTIFLSSLLHSCSVPQEASLSRLLKWVSFPLASSSATRRHPEMRGLEGKDVFTPPSPLLPGSHLTVVTFPTVVTFNNFRDPSPLSTAFTGFQAQLLPSPLLVQGREWLAALTNFWVLHHLFVCFGSLHPAHTLINSSFINLSLITLLSVPLFSWLLQYLVLEVAPGNRA